MGRRATCTEVWAVRIGAVALVVLTAVAPPWAAAQGAPDPRLSSVELPLELTRVLTDYEEAWEAGDGGALAELFTEDAVIRRGNWIRGRNAIRARYDDIAEGDLRLRAVGWSTDGDTGWIVGAYGYPPEADRDRGVFVLALQRGEDGRWLIAADLDHGV